MLNMCITLKMGICNEKSWKYLIIAININEILSWADDIWRYLVSLLDGRARLLGTFFLVFTSIEFLFNFNKF